MRNGIVIGGVEYEIHKTSDTSKDPCLRCDLHKRCVGKSVFSTPCSMFILQDHLRFTYFKKK